MSFFKKIANSFVSIFFVLLLAVLFRSFAFEPFHIPSGSMKPGLLEGDFIFVKKYSYGYSKHSFPLSLGFFDGKINSKTPERGDVVVFRPVKDINNHYIKRVIGLPGDEIYVSRGSVIINGLSSSRSRDGEFLDKSSKTKKDLLPRYKERLPGEEEDHNILLYNLGGFAENTPVYKVPEGHIFVMGDNRDGSKDSRFTDIGFIPLENVVGQAGVIFLSVDKNDKESFIGFAPRFNRMFTLIK